MIERCCISSLSRKKITDKCISVRHSHNRRNSTMWLCYSFVFFSLESVSVFFFLYYHFFYIRAAITPVDEILKISYNYVLYQQLTCGLNNNKFASRESMLSAPFFFFSKTQFVFDRLEIGIDLFSGAIFQTRWLPLRFLIFID